MAPKVKYQPASMQSLWNWRTLTIIWTVQVLYEMFCGLFAVGLIERKQNDNTRSDDGMSSIWFFSIGITTMITAGICAICTGFHVRQYRQNRLMPKKFLILSCVMAFFWLGPTIAAPFAITFSEGFVSLYEGVLFLETLVLIPHLAMVVYSGIVYGRWKKTRVVDNLGSDAIRLNSSVDLTEVGGPGQPAHN